MRGVSRTAARTQPARPAASEDLHHFFDGGLVDGHCVGFHFCCDIRVCTDAFTFTFNPTFTFTSAATSVPTRTLALANSSRSSSIGGSIGSSSSSKRWWRLLELPQHRRLTVEAEAL